MLRIFTCLWKICVMLKKTSNKATNKYGSLWSKDMQKVHPKKRAPGVTEKAFTNKSQGSKDTQIKWEKHVSPRGHDLQKKLMLTGGLSIGIVRVLGTQQQS